MELKFFMRRLKNEQRAYLKKPLGKLLREEEVIKHLLSPKLLISVGDTTSFFLLKNHISPDIMIYDLKDSRKPVNEEVKKTLEKFREKKFTTYNPAGHITDELVKVVKKVINKRKGKIFVDGEEDLAALVVMLYAPKDTTILYGQPGEGIVLIKGCKRTQKKAERIFDEMEKL